MDKTNQLDAMTKRLIEIFYKEFPNTPISLSIHAMNLIITDMMRYTSINDVKDLVKKEASETDL